MKKSSVLFCLLVSAQFAFAQKLNRNNYELLHRMEDTISVFSDGMVFSSEASQRFYNDSAFIKNFEQNPLGVCDRLRDYRQAKTFSVAEIEMPEKFICPHLPVHNPRCLQRR